MTLEAQLWVKVFLRMRGHPGEGEPPRPLAAPLPPGHRVLTGKDGFVPVLPYQPRDVILFRIHKVHGDFLREEGHGSVSSQPWADSQRCLNPGVAVSQLLVQGLA